MQKYCKIIRHGEYWIPDNTLCKDCLLSACLTFTGEILQFRTKIENEQTSIYALEWILKSHLVNVWSPSNPLSHVTENQWEKSLFLVFVSLSARYCLVIPQMDSAWLGSRFVRAQRFVKAPISVNLSQKSALSSGILNRLKIFSPSDSDVMPCVCYLAAIKSESA